MLAVITPILFVILWSTGFIVARSVSPHADPALFVLVRLGLTTCVFGLAALSMRQILPNGRALIVHLVAGALLNGVYLCGSWWAIAEGMPAGIMALLGALQPLVVAVGAFVLLNERLVLRAWAGLAIGLFGVILVLFPLLEKGASVSVAGTAIMLAVFSIIAMSAGTMIQGGSIARDKLCVAGAVQNAGGTLVAILTLSLNGEARWDNSVTLWLALGWSVLGLSIVAVSLLVWMTRHQGATRVSLLLLLIPPVTALEARVLFDERLTVLQIVGFALALGGVLLSRGRHGKAGAGLRTGKSVTPLSPVPSDRARKE